MGLWEIKYSDIDEKWWVALSDWSSERGREQWGELTDDGLDRIECKSEQLLGLL
jgi:hypothetical protein